MSSQLPEEVQFKLKIADIQCTRLEEIMRVALVQNCISGIRGRTIFGLMASDESDALTMDVYTSFFGLSEAAQQQHVQQLTQHIEQQWHYLYQHLHEKPVLRMTPPPREYPLPQGMVFGRYQWEQLLQALAPLVRHANSERFVQNGLLCLEGIEMQLCYVESRPAMFELRVDLGPIPHEVEAKAILKAMLSHNHFLGNESGVWWGLHPDNSHVVMVFDHALSTEVDFFNAPRAPDILGLLKETTSQSAAFWKIINKRNHIL